MNQSSSFTQVANNLLTVLQGYSKTIRLLLVMFVTLIVSAEVWGAETTVSWTATSEALGSGIGNGTIKTGSFTWNYNRTKISGESSTGYNDSSQGAIRLGKNGGVENITFTTSDIPGMIKSVIVECASYQGKHNLSINVGGNAYYSNAVPAWGSGQIGTVSSSGNSSGIITISFTNGSRALYIKSISVTYEENSGSGATPGSGENGTVTMTAGTNGSTCTVNGIEGIKVGASNKGGDMSITIPAGATMLHIYAAAWNNVTGLSLNITPSDKVTITSIALKANSGIANNSPFTLSGSEHDYQFDIPLQNITTETTLKFTSSSTKRFVVWGATYETSTGTTQPSYSVTYETNGGETTCEDNTKYEEGADVMLCGEIPTKENYVFNGWSSTPSVTVTDGKFKMPKSDVTFTAQWSECTGPRITAFNRNGTTDGTYNLGANLGTLSVTAEPSNGGNLRYCWYQYDDATTKDQAKLAAGTNSEATYQIPNNEPCIARHYYCIVSEEGCNKTQESAISGALTLNAIQHTITWSVNGTTQSLSPSSVTDGNNLGTLPTPNLDGICEGKTFVGWTTEANKNYSHETTAPSLITEDTKPNGDVTYYAVFATPEDGAKKTIIFANEWNDTQDLSEHSYFDNAITLSFAKNEGTTAPKYYTSSAAIRLYYRNTMTVTTTAPMQSITFTFVTEDAKGNSISTNPDFGTLSKTPTNQSTESLTHTWNVNTTSVTFTIGKDQNSSESGHCKISQIDVVTGDGDAVTYSNYTTSCTTTYTVTYNGNGNTGGTVPTDNNKYEENAQVTVLGNTSNLVKEGYTFAGWNTQSDGNGTDYAAGATFEITKNTPLYAKWEANTYTVCFNANGGTGTMENQSFTYGAEQALSSNKFTRDSYIFAGWATTADGAVVYTDAQSVSNLTTTNGATVTLYAQWSELYTVTFYNMGSVYTTKTQESVGGSITSPEAPFACEGYTFDGWSATEVDGVPSYEAVTTITPNEDTQLYAVYSKSEDGGGTTIQSITTYQDGVYYIIDSFTDAESKTTYHSPVGTKAGKLPSVDLTSAVVVNDGILTLDLTKASLNDNMKYTISEADGNYSIYNSTTEEYVGASASGTNLKTTNVAWSVASHEDKRFMFWYQEEGSSARSFLYQDSYNSNGTKTYGKQFGNYAKSVAGTTNNQDGKECYGSGYVFLVPATGGSSTTYTTDPSCVPTYTITWKNEDGTILETDENVEYGATPSYDGEEPTKTATAQHTYTFNAWTPAISTVTGDATYTATFTETLRTYTITWKNDDGTTLETDENVPYATTPSYDGEEPTKTATAQHSYDFNGWSPEVTSVTGDATYTATFTETLRTYTITWKNDDGTTLETDENVPYGTTPSYDSDEPTKTATTQHTYDFNGWNPEVTSVTGDATYTAKYTAIVNIIWMVNGQSKGSTTGVAGAHVTPPDVNPIPCGAVLAGWTDAENGEYVYGTSTLYAGEKPSIEVTENKTFYAVFADLEGAVPEMPTVIAYWENQALTKDNGVDATIGTGTMTSNIALSAEYPRTHSNNISSTYPTLTLSNLNLSSHTNVSLLFWARASQQGTITIKSNLSNDAIATITTTKEEKLYVINNIPSSATSITLTYGTNSGSFYFGSVKLYSAATYSFEKLTAENTNGWSGNDWNGYYLITNDQNSLRALDGNGINEDCHFSVADNDGIIEYSIASAFQVEFLADMGYCVKGVGDGLYLGVGDNSVTHSANPIYHESIGYNSLYHSVSSPTSILSWNNSGSKFGFYGSIMTSAPQMYKIMSELFNYRTLCTYDIVLKNNYVDDDSKDGLATITATKTTFNTFTPPTQRPGYIIEGYYAEPQCTKKVVEANQTLITNVDEYTQNGQWIGGNVELYTKWQPLIYNLQSGNFFDWGICSGGTLTLNGSAIGVKYQLYKDDVKYGEEISGTGVALTWEITESGNYTVKSVDPEMLMNGKAVVQLQDPTIVGENTVEVGKTITLTHPGHRDAAGSWVSSNPEIARVDNNTVTGVAAGIVTITFHGLGNCDATHEVTVVNPEYTMTWKVGVEDENIHATTTIISGNPILLPEPPADYALGCCADKFIGWTASTAQTISKADVFTTLAEAQAKFPNITEDKTFYAVFATAAQGVGTSAADFSEMGYENATAVTDPIVLGDGEGHGDATITLAKAQSSKNDAKYYDDGEAVRIYAGGTITIASTYNNATIKNIIFTFAGNDVVGENTITANSGTYDNGTWTGDASTVTFTIGGSTGHRRITSITVTTGVTGSQYTNYVTQCITLPNPALSGGSVPAIAVTCGDFSALSNSQAIVFSTMQNLTCSVTFEVIEGDFLISTAKDRAAQYQSKITVTPTKSGDNTGKLKKVYVRANATDHNENFTGTIKVTCDEITEAVIIDLTATVTCNKFTLTTVDHLGNETEFGTYFAGEVIDTEPTPSSDACTAGYTFDGWSTSEVEYGSLIYNKVSFPYTMPAEDVTLYPVYQCNKTADYHRVTSDLGANNWAGDYLIAYSPTVFADGRFGGKGDAAIGKANVQAEDFSIHIKNNIVPASYGNRYYITLESVENGYLFKTQDGNYNYYSNNSNNDLSLSSNASTAKPYAIKVVFESESDIRLCLSGDATGSVFRYGCSQSGCFFRFYKECGGNPIYLYKKSPLYTTSLICEEVTASDALVTSTADQTVKVNVPITLTSSLHRTTDITAESDNSHFTITNLSGIEEGNHTLAVHYRPTVTTDGIETANIKIKVNNLPVNTFQVTGRHLPENFVIAAKAGGEWVALTAKVSNGTQVAVPIIVDDKTAPTKAIVALNTCQYKLLGLTTKNRFDVNGTAVHLYSTQTEKVLNASTASGTSTYLNTDATHENAEISDNALFYEWQLVTEDLKKYTITNSNTINTSNTRLGYSAATGQWGMYVNNVNVNQELYVLPIESHFTELNVEVMEWGTNSMALRIDGTAPSKLDVTLGENTNTVTLANLNSGNISDIYKAEGIDLTTNDCEIMKIVDNANPNSGTLIRKPILVNTTEAVSSTYRTKLTDDYCAHCDIVILKDAKLTADQGIHDHTSFAKIYVYPGGKLVLDAKSLGVKQQVYLRGGYSWLNSKYALPELYLNGTIDFNGSGNIIYDYYIQNYKYYQFALPYDVQLAKVTDEAGIDNFPVWVKHYNGALRAADPHATSWEWYPNEDGDAKAYFKAGEGYIIAAQPRRVGNTANRPLSIIRFPLGNKAFNSTNGIETDLTITTTAHGIGGYNDGTVTANNVGWNFIGNPFMATWKGDIGYKQLAKHPDENNWDGTYHWVDSDVKYITIMSAESGSDYKQYIASNTELKPFFPFYLQETAVGGSGEITFATSQRIQKAPAMLLSEQPRKAFIQIEIIAEEEIDQTGLFVCDKYSDDIDFDDYEKMFGTSTELPKLWIMHDDKRMAFEAMTESTAATYIPLGYRAPKIGKYIFAINEEASKVSEVEAVYLTDNQTGVTDFDLLSSAYEFESNGELYNDSRFTIRIVLRDESSSTVTGVDNVLHFNSDHPYKFIYQDKMYILRNGLIYDAMGKQVQTINK